MSVISMHISKDTGYYNKKTAAEAATHTPERERIIINQSRMLRNIYLF
jgi:hypothetical protein